MYEEYYYLGIDGSFGFLCEEENIKGKPGQKIITCDSVFVCWQQSRIHAYT
jgi:hypothetical protein